MEKVSRSELMQDGRHVFMKAYTSEDLSHYNWVCIACFYHLAGFDSEKAAAIFIDSISK